MKNSIETSISNSANEFRMPTRSVDVKVQPRTIDSLMHEFSFSEIKLEKLYPWADRFVLGLPLPSWQRDFKWSDEQCQRFITSIWSGVHLGIYVINREEPVTNKDGELEFAPMSNLIVDGQQRLMAIQKYISNEISVPDAEGIPRLYSEVSATDLRRFGNTVFNRSEVAISDDQKLRDFYDLFNFGGTPHDQDERANKRHSP